MSGAGPIRVLVVDDSIVVRHILRSVLKGVEDIELCGYAPDGESALQQIERLRPDVVTLDVDMPVMDGYETLRRLHRDAPDLPVIMFSTLTERGAAATIESLLLGASDYVTKPQNHASIEEGIRTLREQLVPKIRALAGPRRRAEGVSGAPRPAAASLAPAPRPAAPPQAVLIGSSTGGPNVLHEIIGALPADLPVPVLIVQHMPAQFTRILAERLGARSKLGAVEVVNGEPILPGVVYVAPGGRHFSVARSGEKVAARVHDEPPVNNCRPSVDVLFKSAAPVWGAGALGVVLTGMGQDGAQGAMAMRREGAQVLVQDEASSVVWGMPGAVVALRQADAVLTPAQIAEEIIARVKATIR